MFIITFPVAQFRKQDIARALLSVHTSALSQCIYLTSQVNKCKNVYLTGGLFSHPLYRDMFFSAFLLMVYQNCDKVTCILKYTYFKHIRIIFKCNCLNLIAEQIGNTFSMDNLTCLST